MSLTDNEIINAKAHFEYGIKCDIFKEPVLSYAKTVLEAFDEITRQKAEIERFKEIETTVNEFWGELKKLSIAKGKEKPTLEELLEYIEQVKAEAIKDVLKKVKTYCFENVWFETNFEEQKLYQYLDNLEKEKAGEG